MKKILIALLVALLALALVACGGDTTDETTLPTGEVADSDTPGTHIHSYVETVIVAPTCTSLGKSAKQCSCGDVEEGSEMPLPFAVHDANEVNCTDDSVCKTCGKVLVEKYGHNYIETVVSVASCTTTGEITTKCSRCGLAGETKVIPAGHDYDTTALKISKTDITASCKKCGVSQSLLTAAPAIKLDFDSVAEFDTLKAAGFKADKPSAAKLENSALQPNGPLFIGYDASFVTGMSKFVISFDFKLAEQGQTHRGESIFTFVADPGIYGWIAKFYQADGVISTASSGFTAANSYPVTQGKWYNLTAIVDVASRAVNVYIDGTSIGSVSMPDHASAANSNFRFRIYDAMPGNGTSNPYFDNFKVVEIK